MKIKLLLLFNIIFLMTGCTSYTELNDLSIVSSIGIDYKDNKYNLSVSVVEGEIDDKNIEKNITVYHSSQESLDEAFQDIYLTSSKKLYLSHIDLLILSKDAIDLKLEEIIDNFLNSNEYRNNFNVVVLKDTSVDDFFDKNIQAESINDLVKINEKETAMSKPKDFELMLEELLIDGNTNLPTISFYNDKVSLSGFTLIKDFKYYHELSLDESILLNIITNNNTNNAYINNTNVLENNIKINSNKNNIEITLEMVLLNENNQFKINLKNEIYDFLTKYQKKNYDILKALEMIRKNDYEYYKNNINNLLNNVNYIIKINTKYKNKYVKGDGFSE